MELIQSAYIELKNLNIGFKYSTAQISWWLLKYDDLYNEVSKNYNKLCNVCLDWQSKDLPIDCLAKPDYCNKTPEIYSFIKFFEDLDKATQLNKLEGKCLDANTEYLLCPKEDFRYWLIKHYDIYETLGTYFFRYLEFNSKNDKSLYIAEVPDKSFGVAIRAEDFKNCLMFYDVCFDLYDNQKLYPEKIKEMDELFSKIQLPKENYE